MKIVQNAKKPRLSRVGVFALGLSVSALLLVLATLNGNPGNQQAPLAVEGVWARPGLAHGNTAVYMKVTNRSREPLRLVGAASDVAAAVELHESVITPEFVMQMRPIQSVELPPGEAVEFRSGGLHVMLFGLKRALNEGDEFDLELMIEGRAPLSLTVPVRLLGDDDPAAHGDHAAVGAHGTKRSSPGIKHAAH